MTGRLGAHQERARQPCRRPVAVDADIACSNNQVSGKCVPPALQTTAHTVMLWVQARAGLARIIIGLHDVIRSVVPHIARWKAFDRTVRSGAWDAFKSIKH